MHNWYLFHYGRRKSAQENGENSERRFTKRIVFHVWNSDHVIRNNLRNKENYGKKRTEQTATATSERKRKTILRLASNSASTTRAMRETDGTSASVRTVQRLLKQSHIQGLRLKKKPVSTARHRAKRFRQAVLQVKRNLDKCNFLQIVFSIIGMM